jgi:hypothetical protein
MKGTHDLDIIKFCEDPELLNLSLSEAQRVLLKSMYALPLDAHEREIFMRCTGRKNPITTPPIEVTIFAGARSGKDSRVIAPTLLYEACFGQHEKEIAKGEQGVIPCVAQGTKGASIAFGYVRDYVMASPLLRSMLLDEPTRDEIRLTNKMTISIFPSTVKSLRGWSIPCGAMDELAFWRLEGSAESDVEIQTSIRRGMAGFTRPKLIKCSTPYMKAGVLHTDFQRFGDEDEDVLVWHAPSSLMNPSLNTARFQRLDPSRYSREFEAVFVDDLEAFISTAWIDACTIRNRFALPPLEDVLYFAAIDASGGGGDAFTLAICHCEFVDGQLRVIQDVMCGGGKSRTEKLNLESTVAEIARMLGKFSIQAILSDRYAAGWVVESFARHGIVVEHAEVDKSEAYLELEPLIATGRIELLDQPKQLRELATLERRARPGGKPLIDHPRGGHDDHINALGFAAYSAVQANQVTIDTTPSPEEMRQFRRIFSHPGESLFGIPASEYGGSLLD